MGEDTGFRDHPGAVTRLLGISSAPLGSSDLRTSAVLRVSAPRSRFFPITGCPDFSITRSWTSPPPPISHPIPDWRELKWSNPSSPHFGVHFSDNPFIWRRVRDSPTPANASGPCRKRALNAPLFALEPNLQLYHLFALLSSLKSRFEVVPGEWSWCLLSWKSTAGISNRIVIIPEDAMRLCAGSIIGRIVRSGWR